MTWMENALLFLVICVTKVLIDDRRDVFPLSPESPHSLEGVSTTGPSASKPYFNFGPQPSVTETHICAHAHTHFFVPFGAPDGCCPHICIEQRLI